MRAWRQEAVFVALCFAAATAVPFMGSAAQARFSGYGGGAPPLLMIAAAMVTGGMALWSLRGLGFFQAGRPGLGLFAAARMATVLALAAIAADLLNPFPAAINVPWPEAWLFYPAIAVVAEVAMHLVPLALIFALVRHALLAIVLAALVEALFQTLRDSTLDASQTAYVAAQTFVFALIQLWLFRRHGIVALIGFRIVYFLHWHILWGQLRLPLLFGGP